MLEFLKYYFPAALIIGVALAFGVASLRRSPPHGEDLRGEDWLD